MKSPLSTLLCLTILAAAAPAATVPDHGYVFSYFKGNGEDGLHLAWSADGLKWTALNGDQGFLKPAIGDKIMRDPCIARGPDGTFHLVWTDSWKDRAIGYASSRDLIHWSEQKAIPVMAGEPTARNCWAPEVIYDAKRKEFLIFWSTTIPGKFPATEFGGKNDSNHRIYRTTTRDFQTFTPTELFFDPGFNCIDATILPFNGRFAMFFKDESKLPVVMKNLHVAMADDINGPYKVEPQPLNPPGAWVEGPTALQVAGGVQLYFDVYRQHHYGALRSMDLKTWDDVTKRLEMPAGIRHGTAFPVSRDVLKPLVEMKP